jgi:hypothetical protein
MANPFSNLANMVGLFGIPRCPCCGLAGCAGQCQAQAAPKFPLQQGISQLMPSQYFSMLQGVGATGLEPPATRRTPLPQEEIVCATGGIVGWRSWRVPCFGDDLRSFNGELWPVRKALRATCKSGAPQDCLGENCTCGLYSWKERKNLAENMSGYNAIIGEVWMWGKIIEHEKGYRAEYSYPKSFVNSGPDARRLARIYGVKLVEL